MGKLLFEETILKHGLDKAMLRCGTVIVGYSGGADSSCLLRLLKDWCDKNSVKIYALHVDHMIRGEDAERDRQFCEDSAKKLGVPIEVVRADVPSLAKQLGMGIEEAARKVRYDAFDAFSVKLTGTVDGAVIATAHNSSDNLETVIFNMLRGTGTHGLCGIDPIRDGRFIRPLICDSGEDIRTWCKENGVEFTTDSTNADTEYTRNHIRHKIVTEMRQITPSPESAVSRMTELLRRDDDCLTEMADALIGECDTSVSKEILLSAHPAVASRVIRKLYKNAKNEVTNLGEVHVRSVLELAERSEGDAAISLPGKIVAVIDRRRVTLIPENEIAQAPEAVSFTYPDDGNIFENSLCRVRFSHSEHNNHNNVYNKEENIYKLSILTSLSFDKIKGRLKIKYREAGDTYFYGGMTRKVKKLLTDQKLSSEEKALLPVFYDDDGIVWIPGFPPRDGLKPTGGAVLHITCDFTKNISLR